MVKRYSIDESLNIAKDFIVRLGDSVVDDFEGSADNSPLRGLVCEHGSHSYLAMASEEWEWIHLRYPINIDHLYALRRLGNTNQPGSSQISDAQIQQARSEFDDRLNDMPIRERREFRMNLIHLLSRESTILEFDTTAPFNIHGFNIGKKLFIHEPDFSIVDFHEGVQKIVNLGWVGKEFILENYGFRRYDGGQDGFDQGPPGPNL